VTEDGNGKRTAASEFPVQKRGGQGTLVGSGGFRSPIVGALEVTPGDEVMTISAGGAVNRVPADEIPLQGRRTQGRRLVKVAAGDRIVEVTRAVGARTSAPESAAPGSGGDTPPPPPSQATEEAADAPDDTGEPNGDEGQLDLLGG
jgi:DNA gyrase subunit A